MGKRGPKPTPTITLRNRGSWRASARKNEPRLPVEAPDPPEWLRDEARIEWDRVVPILMGAGVLTQADRTALALMCQSYAQYLEADRVVLVEGLTIASLSGMRRAHPAIGIRNAAWMQYIKGCALFGLNPADRANIKAAPKKEVEDAKGKFFKRA